ncbi:MAG: LysM peptidoglycan-binding domain-containing protein [Muribaculum sp.]|nr:LysM peptidoglycan-binding domain-containing protein [Muribaculum sp.]
MRKNTVARGKVLKINTYQRVATGKKKTVEQPEAVAVAQVADTAAVAVAAADSSAIKEAPATPAPKVTPVKAAPKAKQAAPVQKYRYHTVKKGESLSTIARRYKGVSIADIQRANSIKGSNIRAGQKLKIPHI